MRTELSTKVTAPSDAELTLSPSFQTEYPYWLIVRDETAGGRVVGTCRADSESCPISIAADMSQTEPVVHHLVGQTVLGADVVLEGDMFDVTVLPFPARARAVVHDVMRAFPIDISSGRIDVRISNIKETPVPDGVTLYLEKYEPAAPRPKWEYVKTCDAERLRCQHYYDAPPQVLSDVCEVRFRATLAYGATILDRSKPAVARVVAGWDWRRILAAATATRLACDAIVFRNPPPYDGLSTVGIPARLCQAGQTEAALLAALAAAAGAGNHSEFMAWIIDQIAGTGGGGGGTGGDGGGGDGGGGDDGGVPREVYDDVLETIAKELDRNHPGTTGLNPANARAVAEACMKAAAFSYETDADTQGVHLGAEFCSKPSIPIWVVGANLPEKALHNYDALFGSNQRNVSATPDWLVLNYESSKLKRSIQRNRYWYLQDPRYDELCGDATDVNKKHCDEFSDYGTEQGGYRAPLVPSIRSINGSQNSSEGGLRERRLAGGCGLVGGGTLPGGTDPTTAANGSGGSPYLVIPTPEPDDASPRAKYGKKLQTSADATFAICPSSGGDGGGIGST